jgi:ATP synthase protein I
MWRALRVSSVGIEMAVATLIGWAIGYWLDRTFGTEPWLMLVFLLVGVAAGFKGLLRAANEARREATRGSESPPRSSESK